MGKVGDFHRIFALACTGSSGTARGKDISGAVYQACGLCYAINQKK